MSSHDAGRTIAYEIPVGADLEGRTVRSVVQQHLHLSRRMLRQLVANNQIQSNDQTAYLSSRVQQGDIINVMLPVEETNLSPEPVPLDVRYEDRESMIVNKPPGMLTHPTAREREGSLLSAAYAHIFPQVPHCVHRLDRETSGLVLLAKHGHFHHLYDESLQMGEIHRVYAALVYTSEDASEDQDWETIDLPIAQDPNAPSRRIISASGQRAITHYRMLEVQNGVGLAIIVLETGRTHQIRLHFTSIGQPLVGDPVYGRRAGTSEQAKTTSRANLLVTNPSKEITRQALHALGMWFVHPVTRTEHRIFADLPQDFQNEWARRGGDTERINERLRTAFLETEIFANIDTREELT
ncbi:RluA family pseudouridine synthase [Alicyclobacillus ferrooxydans]|uniref:RluA family pseudouridine synthase n=1 Tax=Alicyclobacillus ferrooxydans TaxID=471514 RepID=UPI0006D59C4B|nr:RluA family pseudouridine synthase [Alicyclobacillus ferrooxydans]